MLPRTNPLRQCARFDSRVRSSRAAASYKLLNNSETVWQKFRSVSNALFHASMNASILQESLSGFGMISTSFCRFFAAGPVCRPARHRRCIRAIHTVTPCCPSFRAATGLSYSMSLKVPGTPLAVPNDGCIAFGTFPDVADSNRIALRRLQSRSARPPSTVMSALRPLFPLV